MNADPSYTITPDGQNGPAVDRVSALHGQAIGVNYGQVVQQRFSGHRPVRSAYRERVREIAPPNLVGRNEELAELSAWCAQPGPGYAWWRAPAWAGKSALMSWLVLHPPPEVLVVSFFVTARYASQSDRIAFTDQVVGQLCDLLGEEIPPLTDTTRDTQFLALLNQAAEHCHTHGERLVLIVDGLDEDTGVDGPTGHSIAALLPTSPPAELRILVAGRVNPPIPPDVPDHHPLRDPGIIRTLAASEYAAVIRGDMERELHQLLHGPAAGQQLLGLLTAAGGGLSGSDLAELTDQSARKIERDLGTVAGRSFTRRGSQYQPGKAPDLYLLGHEELRITTIDELGARALEHYRQRIHAWAETYRAQNWPPGTPEYLLRGYHQMLQATGDIPRMIKYTIDGHRHDRMLDITGGDTAALTEIRTVQDTIAEQDDPDLTALLLLAAYRDSLTDRNSNIPLTLPAVWAALGHYNRAEALAGAVIITNDNPNLQVWALSELTGALFIAGYPDRATTLAKQAETAIHAIIDPHQQAQALCDLIRILATAGHHDHATTLAEQAETLTRTITDPHQQAQALCDIAGALATAGHHDHATTLAEQAETLTRTITDPHQQAQALRDIAGALSATGHHNRAHDLALTISDSYWHVRALCDLAGALATAGHHDRADALARTITDPYQQAQVLCDLVRVFAKAGNHHRATILAEQVETLTDTITGPSERIWSLCDLAGALAFVGHYNRAATFAKQAESLARAVPNSYRRVRELCHLVQALADAGRHDHATTLAEQAETLIHSITRPHEQARALSALARTLAGAGRHDYAITLAEQAETLIHSITTTHEQELVVADLAGTLAITGHHDRSHNLASTISNLNQQARGLYTLVQALGAAGRYLSAETLAHTISGPYMRARALSALAERLAAGGHHGRAITLAEQAETLTRSITDPQQRAWALCDLAGVFSISGDLDRSLALTHTITELYPQVRALCVLARTLFAVDNYGDAITLAEQAETLTRSITDPQQQAWALCDLARTLLTIGSQTYARQLVAQALVLGRWTTTLAILTQVHPAALTSLMDERIFQG